MTPDQLGHTGQGDALIFNVISDMVRFTSAIPTFVLRVSYTLFLLSSFIAYVCIKQVFSSLAF